MNILQHHLFRVTRNEDLEVEEDDAENLLKALERELSKRRFGPPVRLEVEQTIDAARPGPAGARTRRRRERGLHAALARWTCAVCGRSSALNREDLSDPAFVPKTNRSLAENKESASAPNVLEAMRRGDVLLHHPYDSFSTSVQRFLEQAAADPEGARHQADALPHLR